MENSVILMLPEQRVILSLARRRGENKFERSDWVTPTSPGAQPWLIRKLGVVSELNSADNMLRLLLSIFYKISGNTGFVSNVVILAFGGEFCQFNRYRFI